MGIELRLKQLLGKIKNEKDKQNLISSCQRLVDPEKMGNIYKVMTITNVNYNHSNFIDGIPPGFNSVKNILNK